MSHNPHCVTPPQFKYLLVATWCNIPRTSTYGIPMEWTDNEHEALDLARNWAMDDGLYTGENVSRVYRI